MSEKRWSLRDLIDLEFFLHQDDSEDFERLAARDRKIYSGFPPSVRESGNVNGVLLRHWLACRRKKHGKNTAPLPGAVWHELLVLFFGGAVLSGLFAGVGLAFSFLVYSGVDPVNVAAYLGVFVGFQAALLLLLTASFLYKYLRGGNLLEASLLYDLAGRLFAALMQKCMAVVHRRAGAETRLKWSSYAGSLRPLRQRYGPLFLLPFFLLVQMFGVSFNLGVLTATLLKLIGSDLAFGWQSTLQINAQSVHTLAGWVSLPWSWFFHSAVPTLEEIEGSRLILKNGIYHLSNHNLASWWPFLCLSVLCYGFLPRLTLLTAGLFFQRRNLARLPFDQGCFRQLVHRLQTPLVSTSARCERQALDTTIIPPVDPAQEEEPNTEKISVEVQKKQQDELSQSAEEKIPNIAALIPDELFADCPRKKLGEQVRRRFGYQLRQVMPFWTMEQSDEEELIALKTAMEEHECGDVLLIQEAWQPPIQELLTWLNLLRMVIGPKSIILIALIGKPVIDTILTPVNQENMQTWQRKLAAVNDPGLQLIELIKS